MDIRQNILLVDGLAASCAGVVVISSTNWLQSLYQLPEQLLVSMALVNLSYAVYSLTLSTIKSRPMIAIIVLVVANSLWVIHCLRLSFHYADSASLFGLLHLVGEAFFVGTLAYFEWKWRGRLAKKRI
jgi:hypothetical protein